MLVVHPTSTCDVCLEGYNTGRPENLPYSILCGHVFCLSCLQSLRQHICPLCRSPFEASDVRRLHVDRTDLQNQNNQQNLNSLTRREGRPELPTNNALGLIDDSDIPRATQLQQKISDLVLKNSFSGGVRERGVRELIQEIHVFLSSEPQEMYADLRASFLLLYRFTDLHTRYQQLEANAFDLRTENTRNRQTITEWERRYQDVQRSRARDQESAMTVETSLRERLRIEELEWQRKYDFASEECAKLRDELDELRFSSPSARETLRGRFRSNSATQVYYFRSEDAQTTSHLDSYNPKGFSNPKGIGLSKTKEEVDMFSYFDPDLFYIPPMPGNISLSVSKQSSDSSDDTVNEKHMRKTSASQNRTSSTTSNISRASDSAAALKPFSVMPALPANASSRQRSESNPSRRVDKAKIYGFENEQEISSSAPSSFMYRAASPTRALFPVTPPPHGAEVQNGARSKQGDGSHVSRQHSLLERQVPVIDNSRFTVDSSISNKAHDFRHEGQNPRPTLPRSMSFQHVRSSEFRGSGHSSTAMRTPPSYARQTHMQVQTSMLSASQFQRRATVSNQIPLQTQSQEQTSEAVSPVQRTPPRPVLPHMHSYFSLYSPAPAKPASPKENRVGARGTLPRRGSLSSASSAAAAMMASSSGPGPSPAVVPPSSLGFGRQHSQTRGLFGSQDSDRD